MAWCRRGLELDISPVESVTERKNFEGGGQRTCNGHPSILISSGCRIRNLESLSAACPKVASSIGCTPMMAVFPRHPCKIFIAHGFPTPRNRSVNPQLSNIWRPKRSSGERLSTNTLKCTSHECDPRSSYWPSH